MVYLLSDDYRYINYWKSIFSNSEVILEEMLEELYNEIIVTNFSYISKFKNLQEIFSKNKFLVLDNVPSINKAKLLYSLGAKGYGNIYMKKEYLISAIEAIRDGNFWLSPALIKGFFEQKNDDRFSILTKREKEIAKLLIDGLTYPQISEKLNIKLRTVKAHVKNIYQKFNVQNRLQFMLLFK